MTRVLLCVSEGVGIGECSEWTGIRRKEKDMRQGEREKVNRGVTVKSQTVIDLSAMWCWWQRVHKCGGVAGSVAVFFSVWWGGEGDRDGLQ